MDTEDRIRELAKLLRECELAEIEISEGERTIKVVAAGAAPAAAGQPQQSAGEAEAEDDGTSEFSSPFVGTFYRAPSPHSPPFMEEGDRMRRGQVLCIIEAMKVMNEIEAECDMVIVEVMVDSGTPVEFGQPLFRFETV